MKGSNVQTFNVETFQLIPIPFVLIIIQLLSRISFF